MTIRTGGRRRTYPSRHRVIAGLGTVTALGVLVLMPAARPAQAVTSRCARQPSTGVTVTATPWPQRRYRPEGLIGIADGRGVTVAVIDSGVDAGHPQLRGRVVAGLDLLDAGDGRIDCAGHGTAVASIIGAVPVSGFGGLAPGATILPVRVTERSAAEDATARTVGPAGLARAVRAAVDRGASVLNMSVVVYEDDPSLRAAVAYAERRDAVLVSAVGNRHGRGDPTPYPAAYPGVIGVGAIDESGTRAPDSQVGPYVDLVAPGTAVVAASPPDGHRRYDGTSFAVPFVAATAALVRQYRPDLSAAQVAARLAATADPTGSGRTDEYGAGEVNPYRAVTDTLVGRSPLAPPAAALPGVPARSGPRPPGAAAARPAGALVLLALLIAAVTVASRRGGAVVPAAHPAAPPRATGDRRP